jgi:hypothetical protein
MNSLSLKESGFAEFIPIKVLSFSALPIEKGSVLVLADSSITGKPASDILYIGKSKKPSKRVFGGYLSGYGGKTTRKINSMLLNDGFLEKVAISWMVSDDPKVAQKALLESFKKEHGEYPSWNLAKKPAQKSPVLHKAVKAVATSISKSKPAKKAV